MRPDITGLTVTEGNDQFYPTPDNVAGKMLAGIDWECIASGHAYRVCGHLSVRGLVGFAVCDI